MVCYIDNNDPGARFDHQFEGWSVWLEFGDPEQDNQLQGSDKKHNAVVAELNHLMDRMRCVAFQQLPEEEAIRKHKFPLHMTLLYNFDLLENHTNDASCDDLPAQQEEETAVAHRLLCQCRDRIALGERSRQRRRHGVKLQPQKWFTFDYPKTADHGKGFGAAVSLLLVEKDRELQQWHDTVRSVFPPDERHQEHSISFTPHLSMVYAPQQSLQRLTAITDRLQEEEFLLPTNGDDDGEDEDDAPPLRAQSLSVWSTRGPTCEWYRVSTISLVD